MTELADFLRARYAEDRQRVLSAGPAKLAWGTYLHPDGSLGYTSPVASLEGDEGDWVTAGEVTCPDLVTVVFDPEASLADIDAKLAVVDACADTLEWEDRYTGAAIAEKVLRLLAAPFSDHSDYREEWAP